MKIFLSVIGTLLLLYFLYALFTIRYNDTQSGNHTGYVTAVDKGGVIVQNYRVYFKSDTTSSQEDLYCAYGSNEELGKKLNEARKNKTKVTISYVGDKGFGIHLCAQDRITEVTQE